MNDDYLLVRKAAIELDAAFWRDCATAYEELELEATSDALRAIADAIELSQANVVYDRDGDAWEQDEYREYFLRAAPSGHWALIQLAAKYGPLSVARPEEPVVEPVKEPVGIGALAWFAPEGTPPAVRAGTDAVSWRHNSRWYTWDDLITEYGQPVATAAPGEREEVGS